MAGLVLEDGRAWGEAAYEFQWEDTKAILDEPSPPYHFLTRARGSSKTTDLAGVSIAMLLTLPDRSRLHWLAADRDQGALAIDAIRGFVSRTPMLTGVLDVQSWRVRFAPTDSTLDILAADAPSAWGIRSQGVFVDEIAQWATTPGPQRLWEAVSTAVAKTDQARMVVLTTAGDPAHWSHKILEHAEGDPMWRVHQVPGPAPWMEQDRLEEQRRRLPESSYRRLFLNEWSEPEDRLTTIDDLQACVTLDGPQLARQHVTYVVGLDIGLKKDRTVASVAHLHREDDAATVVLDRQETWAGTPSNPVLLGDVEAWMVEASRSYNRASVVLDPWQAVHLAQRLRSQRIKVKEFTFSASSVGRLALTLFRLLRDHQLALYDDPELLDELAQVRLVETSPGSYRIDHDSGQHDDRVISLALAAQHLLATASRPRKDSTKMAEAFAQMSAELWKPSIGAIDY